MPTPEFILELRRHIGNETLWLSGANLVVLREGDAGPEVLLGRRSDDGNWAAISGIVEPGENPADTVVREALEEVGIEVEYERTMTRVDSRSQQVYGCSGHMLWIGERTRQLDGAHVELLRRVRNPLGIKLGPTTTAQQAVELADRLDPDREPGRITFITRMGADRVREVLPRVIEGVEETGRKVAWVCDPMHGNTFEAANGYKTRSFNDVVEEVRGFFDVHDSLGTWPGGLHVELTGDDVTECVGGASKLEETDLADRYETVCDPRLNRNQSLELAFTVATRLRKGRRNRDNPVLDFRAKEL